MLLVAPLVQAAKLEVVNDTGETIHVMHPGHVKYNEWTDGKFLVIKPSDYPFEITKEEAKKGMRIGTGVFHNFLKALASDKRNDEDEPIWYLRIKFPERPGKIYIDTSEVSRILPIGAQRKITIYHRKSHEEPWVDTEGHSIPKIRVDKPKRAATKEPFDLNKIHWVHQKEPVVIKK